VEDSGELFDNIVCKEIIFNIKNFNPTVPLLQEITDMLDTYSSNPVLLQDD
jgi:hypothetical protein